MMIGSKCLKVIAATGAATLVASAQTSAANVGVPFLEGFDDAATPVVLNFNDFGGQVNPLDTSPTNGVAPGWTVTGGEALFFDNTDFGDVATALVQTVVPPTADFSVSVDVDIDVIDFTNTKVGVVAMGIDPTNFNEDFSGFQAQVENVSVSGDQYQLVLKNNQNTLATSAVFDLTDGTPNFNLTLAGVFQPDGSVVVTATFLDDGGENVIAALSDTVAGVDIPGGNQFGVRTQIGFNAFEASFDNLAVNVVPEPASLALLGLGGLVMLKRRRGRC